MAPRLAAYRRHPWPARGGSAPPPDDRQSLTDYGLPRATADIARRRHVSPRSYNPAPIPALAPDRKTLHQPPATAAHAGLVLPLPAGRHRGIAGEMSPLIAMPTSRVRQPSGPSRRAKINHPHSPAGPLAGSQLANRRRQPYFPLLRARPLPCLIPLPPPRLLLATSRRTHAPSTPSTYSSPSQSHCDCPPSHRPCY